MRTHIRVWTLPVGCAVELYWGWHTNAILVMWTASLNVEVMWSVKIHTHEHGFVVTVVGPMAQGLMIGQRCATGAHIPQITAGPTCRCGTRYGGSTCLCEAHFRCNEYARYGGAFFITSRRFEGYKAVRPRRPGRTIHMA